MAAKSAKFLSDSPQAKELNHAVTYHIARYSVPISIVEKPGFRQLVMKLNPRYRLPSRRHFTDYKIPQLSSQVKENVMAASLNISFFSSTTDFWTSSTCCPYITITVHFINSEWNLKSFLLDTSVVYEDHTGENIASTVTDTLGNWNLNF